MRSIFEEISRLRGNRPLTLDPQNTNRYRLVTYEGDGTKTSYCFSTPIYNHKSRKLLDLCFLKNNTEVYAVGSNANITVRNEVRLENAEGYCLLRLPQKFPLYTREQLRGANDTLYPTTNGIVLKAYTKGTESFCFSIEVRDPVLSVRANDKSFSLMREQFRPFITISCIGTLDAAGQLIAPAQIGYQRLTDCTYQLTVSPTSPLGTHVLFEINLYENKLFQDTTVESMNPSTNNAFGSVGFIGNTSLYGEQWLYSRLDYSRIPEIVDKRIQKVVLHMPKFNQSKVDLSAYRVSARFCSFGSNWENKIAGDAPISDSFSDNGYQSLDLTSLLVDRRTKTITKSEGLILKPKIKGAGFSVIATGDSYYAPQILEINYR